MKAVIPVAGIGTRLRPHTYTHPKPLIPVAGKPILAYIIENLIEAKVNEFVFIVGYLGDKIIHFVEEKFPNIQAEFVVQSTRKGLGHAIYSAKEKIENEEIIIVLGDTIVDTPLQSILDNPYSVIGTKKVENPTQFGVAILGENQWITEMIEKPKIPKSNLALVGLYKIKETEKLMNSLKHIIDNKQQTDNEYQLTDALDYMLKHYEVKFKAETINNWYDLGKRDILLETNAVLLKKQGKKPTNIGENTIVIPPVFIAETAKIENAIIGPNATIGEHTHIAYSIIKDSIIGDFTELENVHLKHSIIGNDALIKGNYQSLNIGDNTEIDLKG